MAQRTRQPRVDVSDAVDLAVIGGGVVGLATGLAAASRGLAVTVLEREPALGTIGSSRNSGVVHAGLYYPSTSLKARCCVEGRERLWDWVEGRRAPDGRVLMGRRTGKLVVAADDAQLAALDTLVARAHGAGATEVSLVDAREARRLEPLLPQGIRGAVWSPRSGVVDVHALIAGVARAVRRHGGLVLTACEVAGATVGRRGHVRLETSRGPLVARRLVLAAGFETPTVAARIGAGGVPPHRACRGDWFRLRRPRAWSRLLYPAPPAHGAGLGVHLTVELDGGARLGPDTTWLDEPPTSLGAGRAPAAFAPPPADRLRAQAERFAERAREILGPVSATDLSWDGAGLRPKRAGEGGRATDFAAAWAPLADAPEVPCVALVGVESPGLTACLPLGEHAVDVVLGRVEADPL